MNISRYLNAADEANGVTGYTSDVTTCRNCQRPTNCLFKTEDGREMAFCGQECANAYCIEQYAARPKF
jgi:hypothetical protein